MREVGRSAVGCPQAKIARSQRDGRCRNDAGAISDTGNPENAGCSTPSISPISWLTGSQETPIDR